MRYINDKFNKIDMSVSLSTFSPLTLWKILVAIVNIYQMNVKCNVSQALGLKSQEE